MRLHLELLAKTHHIDVAPLVARLDQMMESVSQLLQLARAGQSFSSGNYQHVKLLEDVILPSYDELSTMLDQRQQTLLLPESAADITVQGDATLLRMLLRNLVENAHRYSPQGSNIMIKLQEDGGAVMAVEDEGPGIDESKCGELSKAFVRMDSRYGGIGLGLSIVSRITWIASRAVFPAKPARDFRHAGLDTAEKRSVRGKPDIKKAADHQHAEHGS